MESEITTAETLEEEIFPALPYTFITMEEMAVEQQRLLADI